MPPSVSENSGLAVRDIVFTAGAPPFRSDPNGDFETEQMYAQYVKLVSPLARYPLLMMHGGGLSGVTWETKPDGKPGWQQFFLAAGHDVCVFDNYCNSSPVALARVRQLTNRDVAMVEGDIRDADALTAAFGA